MFSQKNICYETTVYNHMNTNYMSRLQHRVEKKTQPIYKQYYQPHHPLFQNAEPKPIQNAEPKPKLRRQDGSRGVGRERQMSPKEEARRRQQRMRRIGNFEKRPDSDSDDDYSNEIVREHGSDDLPRDGKTGGGGGGARRKNRK